MSTQVRQDAFADGLLAWLNDRFAAQGTPIRSTTLVFEGGLINSIRILEIIAWVERAIGRPIPDRDIRMDNFASAERIAAVFAPEGHHVEG